MFIPIGNKIALIQEEGSATIKRVGCAIAGWGHTGIKDSYSLPGISSQEYIRIMAQFTETDPLAYTASLPRFKVLSQEEYIKTRMTEAGRLQLLQRYYDKNKLNKTAVSPTLDYEEDIREIVKDWLHRTGTGDRIFFDGPVIELALIAAYKCLINAGVSLKDVSLILCGTNTGTGYPSTADYVFEGLLMLFGLTEEDCSTYCCDLEEACTSGGIAIDIGRSKIRSGEHKCVLVVLPEKATTLTNPDDINANLFTDEAGAVLLVASETEESFTYFDISSRPSKGATGELGTKAIYRDKNYKFAQKSKRVQYFVGHHVVQAVERSLADAGLTWDDIDHVFSHQPSGRSLEEMEKNLRHIAKGKFKAMFHRGNIGNSSSASTPALISKATERGEIKAGQYVLVITFGAGTSWCIYVFKKYKE